jgi:RHS repeat-associated protein
LISGWITFQRLKMAQFQRLLTMDALGNITSFSLDPLGNQVERIDPLGNRATSVYNCVSQLLAEQNPLGYRTSYLYSGRGEQVEEINSRGFRTTSLYDPVGRELATIDALSSRTTFYHDTAGRRVAVENPLGYRTSTVLDAAGQALATQDATGALVTSAYDPVGNEVQRTNPLGSVWTAVYDALRRPLGVATPLGDRTSYFYDAAGNRTGVLNALSHRSTFVFDGQGQQIAVQDALAYRTTRVFDPVGRQIVQQDALGYRTTYQFDPVGRPEATQNALGFRVTTLYDAAGRPVALLDSLGRRTSTVYDGVGQPLAVIMADGVRVSAAYDPAGNRTQSVSGLGHVTSHVFDALDRVVAWIDPLSRRVSLAYDQADRMILRTDARGQVTTYLYSERDEETGRVYADGARVTTGYDAAMQPVLFLDSLGRWTRSYDAAGQLAAENGPNYPYGWPVTSAYDGAGNRVLLDSWWGRLTFAYDPLNRMTAAQFPNFGVVGGTATWSYDARGLIQRQEHANAALTTASYDPVGRALQIWHARPDSTEIDHCFYAYDAAGRPLYKQTLDGYFTYLYDPVDQLTSENNPSSGLTTWTYDTARRRTLQSSPQGVTTYVLDAADELLTAQLGTAVTTYGYDLNGSQVSVQSAAGTTTYGWDPANRLQTVIPPSGTAVTFLYRPDGLRVQRLRTAVDDEGNTLPALQDTIWDGPNVLEWIGDGPGMLFVRGPVLAREQGYSGPGVGGPPGPTRGVDRHYHLDGLGTVQALTDGTAAVLTRYLVDAWGNVLSGGVGHNPFVYLGDPGYWQDGDAGLDYVRARWLRTGTGSWLSVDPVPGEPRYAYARNAPTWLLDPSGAQGFAQRDPAAEAAIAAGFRRIVSGFFSGPNMVAVRPPEWSPSEAPAFPALPAFPAGQGSFAAARPAVPVVSGVVSVAPPGTSPQMSFTPADYPPPHNVGLLYPGLRPPGGGAGPAPAAGRGPQPPAPAAAPPSPDPADLLGQAFNLGRGRFGLQAAGGLFAPLTSDICPRLIDTAGNFSERYLKTPVSPALAITGPTTAPMWDQLIRSIPTQGVAGYAWVKSQLPRVLQDRMPAVRNNAEVNDWMNQFTRGYWRGFFTELCRTIQWLASAGNIWNFIHCSEVLWDIVQKVMQGNWSELWSHYVTGPLTALWQAALEAADMSRPEQFGRVVGSVQFHAALIAAEAILAPEGLEEEAATLLGRLGQRGFRLAESLAKGVRLYGKINSVNPCQAAARQAWRLAGRLGSRASQAARGAWQAVSGGVTAGRPQGGMGALGGPGQPQRARGLAAGAKQMTQTPAAASPAATDRNRYGRRGTPAHQADVAANNNQTTGQLTPQKVGRTVPDGVGRPEQVVTIRGETIDPGPNGRVIVESERFANGWPVSRGRRQIRAMREGDPGATIVVTDPDDPGAPPVIYRPGTQPPPPGRLPRGTPPNVPYPSQQSPFRSQPGWNWTVAQAC